MSKLPFRRLIDRRMVRFRNGLFVIAGVAAALSLFVGIVNHVRTSRALEQAGITDRPSLVSSVFTVGVLPGAAGFGGAWFIAHLARKRGSRLAGEGRQVIGHLVGTPTVWNEEMFPGLRGPRRAWCGAMHLASAFLPTILHTCEIEIDGERRRVRAGIFCDEEPLVGLHGEIMVVVLEGGGAEKFPSPWLVCQTGEQRTDDAITAVLEGLAVDSVRAAA